jgi:hypothetical protein
MDLRAQLPRLLPRAIAWAEERERKAVEGGAPLTAAEQQIARKVGVARPELVRVEMVGDSLPMPDDPDLRAAALLAGLLCPRMAGLTLGHAIFICRGHRTRRLLSHELRHVQQYEQHGSIAGFLPVYLAQVLERGYDDAPFEQDARDHEWDDTRENG